MGNLFWEICFCLISYLILGIILIHSTISENKAEKNRDKIYKKTREEISKFKK